MFCSVHCLPFGKCSGILLILSPMGQNNLAVSMGWLGWPEILVGSSNGTDAFWFGLTGLFGTSFEGGPLWPVWSFQSVGPKCPFPFDKIVISSTALLYPAHKNNNQTWGGLGRVCATRMYRSIGQAKFPKFKTGIFVEWEAPRVVMVMSCTRPTVSWLHRHRRHLTRHSSLMMNLNYTIIDLMQK